MDRPDLAQDQIESPVIGPDHFTEEDQEQMTGGFVAQPGTLYVVGTPIGNLGDISPRARSILAGVDLICAEDTRNTGLLLSRLKIGRPLLSFHEHNTQFRIPRVLDDLRQGRAIAIVSDAGMPCISDPGSELVAACREEGLPVVVIPGPTALITALAGSGLDSRRFHYEGFLAAKGRERKSRLQAIASLPVTAILYEAPHRLLKTLTDLAAVCGGDRPICLARELTKRYEAYQNCNLEEAITYYNGHAPRGEYVIILASAQEARGEGGPGIGPRAGGGQARPSDDDHPDTDEDQEVPVLSAAQAQVAEAARAILEGCSVRDLTKRLKGRPGFEGMARNELYRWAMALADHLRPDAETAE